MLSEVFYTILLTSSIGLILTISKLFFKSRCKEVSIFCLKCIRDTESEQKELEFELTHQNNNNLNNNNI
jgi:hypothetical protein